MKNLFSYDSKFVQALIFVTDILILNVLFLICSLPLITIGAAQCGLHTGIRALMAKESLLSPAKAFFKGFRTNIGQITWLFCVLAAIIGVLAYCCVTIWLMAGGKITIPLAISLLALCLCCMFQCMLTMFHSRFQCSTRQLLRNTLVVMFSRPIRSLLQAALLFLPLIIFLANMETFIRYTAGWFTIYYASAALACYFLFKKTFETLTVNIVSE